MFPGSRKSKALTFNNLSLSFRSSFWNINDHHCFFFTVLAFCNHDLRSGGHRICCPGWSRKNLSFGFQDFVSTSLGIWMDSHEARTNQSLMAMAPLGNFSASSLCRQWQQTISHPDNAHQLISWVRVQSHLLCEQVYYWQAADTLTFAKSN